MRQDGILDLPTKATETNVYLKKSAKLLKISGALLFFSIVSNFIKIAVLASQPARISITISGLLDILVALPILSIFVIAPFGLYLSWKSHKNKEGHAGVRMRYMLGHLIGCILLLFMVITFVRDIARLIG